MLSLSTCNPFSSFSRRTRTNFWSSSVNRDFRIRGQFVRDEEEEEGRKGGDREG